MEGDSYKVCGDVVIICYDGMDFDEFKLRHTCLYMCVENYISRRSQAEIFLLIAWVIAIKAIFDNVLYMDK